MNEWERVRAELVDAEDIDLDSAEVETARLHMQEWARAANFTGEVAQFQQLIVEYRHAKDVMVNSNMRLVVSIARRYVACVRVGGWVVGSVRSRVGINYW